MEVACVQPTWKQFTWLLWLLANEPAGCCAAVSLLGDEVVQHTQYTKRSLGDLSQAVMTQRQLLIGVFTTFGYQCKIATCNEFIPPYPYNLR